MNFSIIMLFRELVIFKITKRMLKKLLRNIRRIANELGSNKRCNICGRTFTNFTKYKGGSKSKPEFHNKLKIVGSDIDNFGCMYCGSNDRERHLFMFFDTLMLWDKFRNKRIIHFAPETHLTRKIRKLKPLEYVLADLYPKNNDTRKIDATSIPFENGTFDYLIANHILEHIPDYREALSEFYRILKPKGLAILQTPYSRILKYNFEDDGINNDELKLFFYGQEDHVRTFGEYQFLKSLEEIGFILNIKKHDDYFDDNVAKYYGVPKNEDLIMVEK